MATVTNTGVVDPAGNVAAGWAATVEDLDDAAAPIRQFPIAGGAWAAGLDAGRYRLTEIGPGFRRVFIIEVPDTTDTLNLLDVVTSLQSPTLKYVPPGVRVFKGDKGDKGEDGQDGQDGLPGAKGDKGDKGDPGDDANVDTHVAALNAHPISGVSGLQNALDNLTTAVAGKAGPSDIVEAVDAVRAELQTLIAGKADYSDVTAAVADVVDTSPDALNTLNELAAALGDDPAFATTITALINTKETPEGSQAKVDAHLSGASHPALSNSTPTQTGNALGQVGTAVSVARGDHRHGFASATPVALGDVAAEGNSGSLSRSNHVHPKTGLASDTHLHDLAMPGAILAYGTNVGTASYWWSGMGAPSTLAFNLEALCYFVPFWVSRRGAFDKIGCCVTVAGAAGSVLRFGLARPRQSVGLYYGLPGELVADYGTVSTETVSTATAISSIDLAAPQVLDPGLWYLMACPQGAPATRATVQGLTLHSPSAFNTGTELNSAVRAGTAVVNVPGAFPSIMVGVSGVSVVPKVMVRACAIP